MNATAAPIPFAGSTLGSYRHVCAFFASVQDEYETVLPFVRDGLERGERAYHVLPAQNRERHLDRLRRAGIDVAAAQRRRQLEVAATQDVYLRDGRFDKDAMLAAIEGALETGASLGFELTRLVAHADTVWEDWRYLDDWVEYESRLNIVLHGHDDPVICLYDPSLLNGRLAVDIIRTHPVTIIGGKLHENPFFVPSEEFVRQLERRDGTNA